MSLFIKDPAAARGKWLCRVSTHTACELSASGRADAGVAFTDGLLCDIKVRARSFSFDLTAAFQRQMVRSNDSSDWTIEPQGVYVKGKSAPSMWDDGGPSAQSWSIQDMCL